VIDRRPGRGATISHSWWGFFDRKITFKNKCLFKNDAVASIAARDFMQKITWIDGKLTQRYG
jgi:hypothetical protein